MTPDENFIAILNGLNAWAEGRPDDRALLIPTIALIHQQAEDIDRLRAVLREVEWVASYKLSIVCPACRWNRLRGHAPGCLLEAALASEKPTTQPASTRTAADPLQSHYQG